jgi:hypothetical protein
VQSLFWYTIRIIVMSQNPESEKPITRRRFLELMATAGAVSGMGVWFKHIFQHPGEKQLEHPIDPIKFFPEMLKSPEFKAVQDNIVGYVNHFRFMIHTLINEDDGFNIRKLSKPQFTLPKWLDNSKLIIAYAFLNVMYNHTEHRFYSLDELRHQLIAESGVRPLFCTRQCKDMYQWFPNNTGVTPASIPGSAMDQPFLDLLQSLVHVSQRPQDVPPELQQKVQELATILSTVRIPRGSSNFRVLRTGKTTRSERKAIFESISPQDLVSLDSLGIRYDRKGTGGYVHKDIAERLKRISDAIESKGMYIMVSGTRRKTDGPNTYRHKDSGHYSGHCIDIEIRRKTKNDDRIMDPKDVIEFANNAPFKGVYTVHESFGASLRLRYTGIGPFYIHHTYPHITKKHFSVYFP